MLPRYEVLDGKKPLLSVPFGKFCIAIVSLPLFSFIFCIVWSLLFFFEKSTRTHCDVPNYLPSISAAIGNYQPQRIVWQLAICIHFGPRILVTMMYFQYYKQTIRRRKLLWAYFTCLLNVLENFALLGLTLYTSDNNYDVHKVCFVSFVILSELYMILTCALQKNDSKIKAFTRIDRISLQTKKNLTIVNIISILVAGYFFMRHNTNCEAGLYTMFALAEYVVVLTNMGYHMTAYWDLSNRNIEFDWYKGIYFN